MCFSMEASYASTAVLVIAGAYCVNRARRIESGLLPIAVIPLGFGIQQAFEGVVWSALESQDALAARRAALGFLFFALWFWPTWIPLACGIASRTRARRRGLLRLAAITALAGAWAFVPLAQDVEHLLTVDVLHHSLRYAFEGAPVFAFVDGTWWQVAYIVAVSLPFFVTDRRVLAESHFGLLVLGSAFIAQIIFSYAFVSVWCAFAALLSAALCRIFARAESRGVEG